MLDVIDQIHELVTKEGRFAVCTVIHTWRSSPRPIGSALIVSEDGDMYGSVSGGCVEGAVVTKALEVLESGEPQIATYGVADEEAWEIGLSCGGAIEVYIFPFTQLKPHWSRLSADVKHNKGIAFITVLESNETALLNGEGIIGGFVPDYGLVQECINRLSSGLNGKVSIAEKEYFIQVFPSKPKMLLIGSAHITVEMVSLGDMYGFETIVIDPRDTFAKKTGYRTQPSAIHVKWPQEILPEIEIDKNTYVVILSHDPKIDDEALKLVLRGPARYIGALGSKKTHAKRVARLQGYGFTDEEISRINAPIGIDISSQLPREIALSIMAEVISFKNSGN